MGYTAKSPRWAMAYKFKAAAVETQLDALAMAWKSLSSLVPKITMLTL